MSAVLAQVAAALPQLISSVIIAALTWIASLAINWFKTHRATGSAAQPHAGSGALTPRPPAPAAPSVWRRINWGQALLHIGILQLVVNAEGVIVGFVVGAFSRSLADYQRTYVIVQAPLGTLTAAVVFMIFALRVARPVLWPHLAIVAAGTVALTLLVNSILVGALLFLDPFQVLLALVQAFVAMGLGGWVATLLRPRQPAPIAAASISAPVAYAPPGPAAHTPPYPPPASGHVPWPGAPHGPNLPPPPGPPRQP